jgi:hypothetical protein
LPLGHYAAGKIRLIEKIHIIRTQTRDLPACSIVRQPTTLPRVPEDNFYHIILFTGMFTHARWTWTQLRIILLQNSRLNVYNKIILLQPQPLDVQSQPLSRHSKYSTAILYIVFLCNMRVLSKLSNTLDTQSEIRTESLPNIIFKC